jgi:Rrf2 family transcriptional regulator, nitric oxide-sensitive transcriptional repressor
MISQTAEYALRAVIFLASANGAPCTTRKIARGTRVKREYLSKVLQALRRAKLVAARPGVGGGFTLARPPSQLTVLDVVASIEPTKRIRKCPLGLVSHQSRLCPLHARLDAAADTVESAFRGTTIEELLATPRAATQCPFPVSPLTKSG